MAADALYWRVEECDQRDAKPHSVGEVRQFGTCAERSWT